VKNIENPITKELTPVVNSESNRIKLKPENLEVIKRALVGVTREGTSARVFAGAGYVSGGKTGTAQAIGIKKNEKYDAKKLAEHHRDHSLYMTFAPIDNPRIALAVIVENAGFGAQAAAPIARIALDYYLLGKRPETEKEKQEKQEKGKVAAPKPAAPAPTVAHLPANSGQPDAAARPRAPTAIIPASSEPKEQQQ
jgi:penicillin-binding protein 2